MKINNQQSTLKPILWLVIPSLAVIAALWFDWLPWLRGNAEWQWPLRANVDLARAIVPLLILAAYVAIGVWWLRVCDGNAVSRRKERVFLLFLTLAAPVIQLALAFGVARVPLLEFFGPTVSVHNSGYFTTAVTTPDLNQLLADYPAIMPTLPIHAQSHPPGPVVAHWLSWQAFQTLGPAADGIAMPLRTLQCHNPGLMALDNAQIASAVLGMLLPLIGGLAVWPLFTWGKRVVGSRAAAVAALLFPILPLFAMWPAQWDQIYPLLLLTGLYLAHTGLAPRPLTTLPSAQAATSMSLRRIFLAGVPLSIASFFSVGNFVLMVIVGLYGVVWLVVHRMNSAAAGQSRLKPTSTVLDVLKFGTTLAFGSLSIWIAYAVIYGVSPLDVIATGSRLAFESTTGNRTYGAWLIGNPLDFAVFLGVPLTVALIAALVGWLRQAARRGTATDTGKSTASGSKPVETGSFGALIITTFGMLLALILSGIVRGEVGRLWMYFGPLLALAAASRLTRHSLLVISLVALQLLVMNTRWLVNDSFLDAPPKRSVVNVPPAMSIATDYAFGDQIVLRGYDVRDLNHQIDLTLYWQALAQPPHAYTVFAHVFDANGQAAGQQDNMPVNNQLPTSCWQPGEYVSDPYTIALTDGARAPFTIEVGLYQLETGVRLPLNNGTGTSVRLQAP